jgi:hypothetical protein
MRVPSRLLARIRQVKAKRPRVVLEHILEHGHVTTQELRDLYGYNHPPRAARDVREQGIPLETFRVVGRDGRRIAAYRLAFGRRAPAGTRRGRRALPKALKEALLERDGPRCHICWADLHPRYLQIDHRVPYEVAGDRGDPASRPVDFMLLCSSCNRAKSWSCEHCGNWQEKRRVRVCRACYWAEPERYAHIATIPHRRVVVTWARQTRWTASREQGHLFRGLSHRLDAT